jgi:hypothetical protein
MSVLAVADTSVCSVPAVGKPVAVKQRKRGVPPAPAAPRGLAWVTSGLGV